MLHVLLVVNGPDVNRDAMPMCGPHKRPRDQCSLSVGRGHLRASILGKVDWIPRKKTRQIELANFTCYERRLRSFRCSRSQFANTPLVKRSQCHTAECS